MYMVFYGGMYMKYLVLTRRRMLTICACVVVCCLAVVFSITGIQAVQTAYVQKVPVYSVPTPDKQVALTFNCAWDIDHTEEMQTVQWDIDSFDQHNITVQEIADKIMKEVKSGSIILLHNRSDLTLEALPYVIQMLQSEGYEIISVSQLMRNATQMQSE